MNSCIQLKKSNCKNCYKCIRHCPVKSIRFSDGQANIVKDECVLCGMCFVACPQNAKQIRNDVSIVKEMIATKKPVIASIAPSFVANYEGINIKLMESALKKLGFYAVEETAIGATIVKKQYENMIRNKEKDIIISSCCHTVNTLIQKYYPDVLCYLADVISPMQAHCAKIKSDNPDAYTVFIGPCISKKDEADQYKGLVDCVITFEELSEWIAENNIAFEDIPDETNEGKTRLFPTAGGILRSMDGKESGHNYIVIDGMDNCIKALKDIENGKITNCFIEMSACVGSCIGGPAMDKEHRTPIRDFIAINRYAKEQDFNVNMPAKETLHKNISHSGLRMFMPGSKAIHEILIKMGKSSAEQELNCGSCGYNTCREKAIAVFQGKADLTMCLPFLKEKAESFSDNIIQNTPNGIMVLNEDLEIQQINKAACKIMKIKNSSDVLGTPVVRILNPAGYMDVMINKKSNHDNRYFLAEYQIYVEETIIYDENYQIIISIMRDVTDEELLKSKKDIMSKKAMEITDKVIEKQMRVVQEIASLLGETTAETKIALTNLKETLNNE